MIDVADVGLCCGSMLQTDLFGLAEAGSAAGFRSITIWPTLYSAAIEAGHDPTSVRTRLDDLGVRVVELDPICSWLPVDIPDTAPTARFAQYSVDDFFAIADVLGTENFNVIRGDDADVSVEFMSEHLGALADRAALDGRRVYLEFLPWSPVHTLEQAVSVVTAVGRSNCGIHLDVWHLVRSGGSVDALRSLDPSLLAAVQLSDLDPEPWDDLLRETSSGRRLLGHGDGTARTAVDALDAIGATPAMSVEIFSRDLMALSPADAATRIAESIRTF